MTAVPLKVLADPQRATSLRVTQIVREYDAQGDHRTASEADLASAAWLAEKLQLLGIDAELEHFPVSRIDPNEAFLQAADRQLSGIPLFDASFTLPNGIVGRLGPVGSDAEIGLLDAPPQASTDRPGPLHSALDGHHKALVVVTRGARPGLSLIDAPRFLSPRGVPALQISSAEAVWLHQLAEARMEIRLVATATPTPTKAANVIGMLRGTSREMPPVVVMTPRSGWWHCTGERAGGIAAWLETAHTLSAARPLRDVAFLASTGHELGYIGLDVYLQPRATLARSAAAWVHLGANIAATPHIRLQSADLTIQQEAIDALALQGLAVSQIVPPGVAPGGEAGTIFRRGGRYLSLQGENPLFHNAVDRWPEAIDVLLASRQATAFANLVRRLATTV